MSREIKPLNIRNSAIFEVTLAIAVHPSLKLITNLDLNSVERVEVSFDQSCELIEGEVGTVEASGRGGGVELCVGLGERWENSFLGGVDGNMMAEPENIAGRAFAVGSGVCTCRMNNTVDFETSTALEPLIVAVVVDHVGWGTIKVEVSN